MKTTRRKTMQFLALVPHRDTRLQLRAWSASLFGAGLDGAWSFPHVAPLAVLNRPLLRDELKSLARALREYINNTALNGEISGGKFIARPPAAIVSAGDSSIKISIFGTVLQPYICNDFFEPVAGAVLNLFSPPVIGSALVQADSDITALPAPPEISFRAAALANMSFCPIPAERRSPYSFEWKIDALHWLPKKQK